MNFRKIGVILGGPSEEREISLCTGRAIAGALRSKGHDVVEIGEHGTIEDSVLTSGIDIAFIALHGRYGEDGTIQRFLEDIGIPYTGSGPLASANALNKVIAKSIFVDHSIPTPEYFVIDSGENNILEWIENEFSFPMVVKPADSGSSIGLSIVKRHDELAFAIEEAVKYSPDLIIERYISGEEITVGILGDAPLPVIRIVPKAGYYSYRAKYTKGMTDYIVPAELPSDVYRNVQYIGLEAHKVLGCRDFSRVDMRLDSNGNVWVLEVNTIPGFTETSLLPKAASAIGIGFGELCERILALAWERKMARV